MAWGSERELRCRAARVIIYVMTRKAFLILLGGFAVTGGHNPKPKQTASVQVRRRPVEVVLVSTWPGRWRLMFIDEWDARGQVNMSLCSDRWPAAQIPVHTKADKLLLCHDPWQ